MSKQIKNTARGLAALGRGEDKMLVHMTPREVMSLQELAKATGGSLTINPHTGLPEAGWLSTILPMFAGGIATVASGGTLGPAALALLQAGAGAAGGALGAKMEGSDAKTGALFGALGGVGGGGIANSLATGASQGAAAAGNAQLAATNAAAGAGAAAPAATTAATAAAPTAGTAAAQPAAQVAGAGLEPVTFGSNTKYMVEPLTKENMSAYAQKGLGSLVDPGGITPSSMMKGMSGPEKLALMGGTMGGMTNNPMAKYKADKPYYYHTSAEYDPNGFVSFGPGKWSSDYDYERLGTTGGPYAVRAASGGSMDDLKQQYADMLRPSPQPPVDTSANDEYMARLNALVHQPPPVPEKPYQQPVVTPPTSASTNNSASSFWKKIAQTVKNQATARKDYKYDPSTGEFTKMAGGGIASLPSRMVKGPGDGTSDSIPAMIGGKQPAALADSEFVVDARTVAELGNGSSEAGAKALYDMVKRVEASRRTAKRGSNSNAVKHLPA